MGKYIGNTDFAKYLDETHSANIKANNERIKKKWDQIEKDNEYYFGKYTNKAINTIADLGLDIAEGGMGYLEGVTDWATYRLADVSDFFGGDSLAEDLRGNADFDSTATLFGKNQSAQQNIFGDWTQGIEKASWSPDFVDQVFSGVGQVGMAMAASALTGGGAAVTAGITYASSYGNARSAAKRDGLSDREANKVGIIHGVAEAISEQVFAGIPGMKVEGWGSRLTGKMSDMATKYFGTTTGKLVLKAMDSFGEGTEEIISNVLVAVGNDIMHKIDSDFTYGMQGQSGNIAKDALDQLLSSDSWNQFFSAAFTSALTNAGKAVIDTRTQNKILNAYAKDNNMSFQDAKYILTGQIESAKQEIKADKVEYNSQVELEEMAKQRVLNYMKAYKGKNVEAEIDRQADLEISKIEQQNGQEIPNDIRLRIKQNIRTEYENQINSPQRYQNFTLEKEVEDENHKELYEDFQQKSNNTQEAHGLYELMTRLIDQNTNAKYKLINNEDLVNMGLLEKKVDANGKTIYGRTITQDGKTTFKEETINGLNTGNTILINADGVNAFEATIWHEIGHAIKDTDPTGYNELKRIVNEVYGENDLKSYKELYGDIPNLEDEYINDRLGDMLNNEKFINRISQNRNIFERIIDEIKRLIRHVTASSEKRKLMDLQEELEKRYIQLYKAAKFEGGRDVAFSLEKNSEIVYNSNGNLDRYKSSTLFNQMMQRSKPGVDETLYVNDYNNYYRIHKNTDNDYTILSKIPIEGNEEFIDRLMEEDKKYDKDGRKIVSNVQNNEIGYRYDNTNNVAVEGERTWTNLADEFLEEYKSRELQQGRTIEQSRANNKGELESSFNLPLYSLAHAQKIENSEDISKIETTPSPYQTMRPKVRGGWNLDKIQKQLKNESSNRVNSKDIAAFDNLDDIMDNVFYHGSTSAHDNLKAGSTLPEQYRTGGYGEEYHTISLSGSKNTASNFSSMGQNGVVMPVILKKDAKVIEMPNIEDSIELEDYLPQLWDKGIDAVKIGDWDVETKGYGEQELVVLNPRAIMTLPEGNTYYQNYHKPKFANMTKEEVRDALNKRFEKALNDPKNSREIIQRLKENYGKILNETNLPTEQNTKSNEGEIQGLENYTQQEVKDITNNYINEKLQENGYFPEDIKIVDSAIHGSRNRGTAKANSDLDVVVQYDGDIREDDLFNILNGNGKDNLYIDGIKVDINPIQENLNDYMVRSNAYDQEVLNKNNSRYSLAQDNQNDKIITTKNGKLVEYNNYYDYAKDITKNKEELAKELLFKHYSHNFVIPANQNETILFHGTDATYDYDGLKVMDFDKQTMDRNYGDYFYITTNKDFSHTFGNQVAEFIIPNDKILSLDEYRQKYSNKTDEELFEDYWALEMPDNEYIVKDVKPIIDYSKERALDYIEQKENTNETSNTNISDQLEKQGTKILEQYNKDVDSAKQMIQDYLEENGIENPTKQDMMNAFGWYEEFDASNDMAEIQRAERIYNDAADELLRERSTKDSQGRELSQEQKEYFKDSKVRDNEGNLITLYHGSNADFTIFDRDLAGSNGTYYGAGFYLTPSKENAQTYARDDGNIIESYANITNPYTPTADIINEDGSVNFAPSFYEDFENRFKDDVSLITDWETLTNRQKGRAVRNILQDNGYDGIIVGDTYVAFESNQIKNVDNTNPTSNPDIRYSLSPSNEMVDNTTGEKVTFDAQEVKTQLPTDKTLMAIHNLNESKLNGVLDLGGFPVPSIAITNPNIVAHGEFGDISAIFSKETIDPKNRKNEVYDRDVWSPTFPRIEYEVNDTTRREILKALKLDKYGDLDEIQRKATYELYQDVLENHLDSQDLEGLKDRIKHDRDIKYAYMKSQNQIEPVYRQYQFNDDVPNEALQTFLEQYQGSTEFSWNTPLKDLSFEQTMQLKDTIKRIVKPYLEEQYAKYGKTGNEVLQKELASYDGFVKLDKFIRSANNLNEKGLDYKVMDEFETLKKVDDTINKQDYEKWVDDTFTESLIKDKGIRNNKDIFTPSGNRRSFKATHDPVNLETLTKALTRGATKGGQEMSIFGTGYGRISAQTANQFRSIQDIKQNENRIMTREQAQEIIEPLSEKLYADTEKLAKYYMRGDYKSEMVNNMQAMDATSQLVEEFAGGKLTSDNLKKLLTEWGYKTYDVENVPQKVIDDIIDDLNQAKQMPTDYFEAKPQRAVGLDEIGALVIPSNLSEETKQRIKDNNIQYTEYNPDIEGDRAAKINEYQQYMFSLSDKAPQRGYGTYTEDITNNRPIREAPNLPTAQSIETNVEQENLPTEQDEGLPFIEPEQTAEDRMAERRKKLADDRISNMLEKQTFKSVKEATKMAKSYLGFNQQETESFKKQINRLAAMPKDNLIKSKNYNRLKDIIKKYSSKDMTFVNQEIKELQKEIRHTPLIISQDLKSQITDWSAFKKASGLDLYMGDKSNVDTKYQELIDSYPGMLDNTLTNYADQLQELSEFLKRDTKYVEHFDLNEDTIDQITNKVWEKISNNALTIQEIDNIQNEINQQVERRTREVVQNDLLNQMGITLEDIAKGKDITALGYQRTDPVRVNEKVFGMDTGSKINEATTGFVKHQEAERVRYVNQEKAEIKDLGIKARSKESAAVQKYGEGQYVNKQGEVVEYNDQNLMAEFPNVETQEKIKNAARVLRNKYDTYIEKINESLTDMGYDPIPKRKDYFMHFMELEDKLSQWGLPFSRENLGAEDLPTDINGLTDQFKPGKNFFASAMERKGVKTSYDAITGIDRYLDGASNLMYHTESIQRYRTLSKLIRNTYGQRHGLENLEMMTPEEAQQRINDVYDNKLTKYAAWLDEQANALAGKKGGIDRAAERFLGRKVYTLLGDIKKQVGSNMTGFNVRSSLTNFASAIQGASKTQKLAALKGFAFALKNYNNIDPLVQKSDFLATRFGTEQLSRKAWQKISNAGQVFMNASDRFTSLQIWGGKYYEGLQNGLSEQASIRQADEFAAKIMGDRSKGQTAEMFNSKTLGLFTQFQLEVNNQWSSMIHDNKMAMQQNPGAKTALHVANQLGQLYAASWFFNNFMKAVTGSDVMFDPIDILLGIFNPDDDDEDLEERSTKALGKIIDQLPMASVFTGGRIPMSEAFTGISTLAKKVTGQKNTFGAEYTWEDVKDDLIASSFFYLFPTGFGQIKKTAQGLGMYGKVLPTAVENALDVYHNENLPLAGVYTKTGRFKYEADTSPFGVAQAALFGRNANANAREYREKGWTALTEKQVQTALDANLPISEYREINAGITAAKQKAKEKGESQQEAQYDYIYNLPLSMKQKNALLNSKLGASETTTDKNGYVKYTDGSKTYWYDEKNDVLYNSKYREMDNIKVDELEKYNAVKDLNDYSKYGSLAEFNYASKNPEKYAVTQQIASFDEYNEYKDDIASIKENYNDGTTAGKNRAKQEVFNYINGLKLNKYQKIMLQKMAGGYSIKDYQSEMFNYINRQNLTKQEKETIYKELFK